MLVPVFKISHLRYHPTYGVIESGYKTFPFYGQGKYECNHLCEIRNAHTKRVLKPDKRGQLRLSENGKGKNFLVHRVGAMTHIPVADMDNLTVDHIDENYKNNDITNLRWLPRSENSSLGKRKRTAPTSTGHKVYLFSSPNNEEPLTIFHSKNQAAKEMKVPYHKLKEEIVYSPVFGLVYVQVEKNTGDLANEKWYTSATLIKNVGGDRMLVSNFGRIKCKRTHRITVGYKHREDTYRYYGNFFVHKLMFWAIFDRDLAPNEQILHLEGVALDEDGCKINHIEYIRVGTASENMQEFADYKVFKKQQEENQFIEDEVAFSF